MKLNKEAVIKGLEDKGVMAKTMCEKLDMKDYQLSKYLAGANCPRSKVYDIADYLGLDFLDIVHFEGFNY